MTNNNRFHCKLPVACLLVAGLAASGMAQSAATPAATPDPETVALAQKIQALESALAEVKAELAQRPGAAALAPPAAAPAPASPPVAVAQTPKPEAAADVDIAALTATHDDHALGPLSFRGFSDFTYGRPNFDTLPNGALSNSTQGFSLGDFDLFTTARLGDHLSMLGELLVTSDFTNEFSAEMDRLLLTYSVNDYFQISGGKFNTAIGYYTNEFHRARFFQTATGRPILFTDEDEGGILPVHSIGLTATGKIPSGELGLHWVAELANGRASDTILAVASGAVEPTQNFADENNGKAVNFALYARPTWWNGFEVGASMLVDRMYPVAYAPLKQRIYSAHVALVRSHIELLTEGVYMRHQSVSTQQQFNTVSSYAQASYLFGRIRPYLRYEYQNVPVSDPIFGTLGRKDGPSVGVRFDWSEFVALKLQYGRLGTNTGATANDAQAQVAFSF